MFEYLKKYCNPGLPNNSFYPIEEQEIIECEKFLGYELPSQLKIFYQEIGCGFLTHPHKYDEDYIFYNTNRINGPSLIVEMLEKGQESGYISEDVYEDLQPGDIPFFEVGDSSWFFKMKALSDNPNSKIFLKHSYESIKWYLLDPPEFFPKNLVPFAEDGGGNLTCFD